MRPTETSGARHATAILAAGLLAGAAATEPAAAQESEMEWDCFRSWTVRTAEETGIFRVNRSPWALRWRRTTPTHSEHDGVFAELFRAEEGERTQDQVAAVNTDHDGHEGTLTVEETGAFWLAMESWSEETAWKLEACVPAAGPGPREAAGSRPDPRPADGVAARPASADHAGVRARPDPEPRFDLHLPTPSA